MSCLSRQHIGTVNRPLCFCSSWRCHLDGRMGSQREGRVRNHRDRLFGWPGESVEMVKSMKAVQLLIQKVFVSEHTPLVLMARRTDEKLELQWTLEGHQLGVGVGGHQSKRSDRRLQLSRRSHPALGSGDGQTDQVHGRRPWWAAYFFLFKDTFKCRNQIKT